MIPRKSIPHEKAMMQAFRRDPELLLHYINSCIEEAVTAKDTAPLVTIPMYLNACGYKDLFGLLTDMNLFVEG